MRFPAALLTLASFSFVVAGASLIHDDLQYAAFGEEALERARSPETVMQLHMMTDKGLAGMGAVCLDGSDAGFYFAPASDPKNANDWQIYFQGGGWCYDEIDCWGRSNGVLGSSANWSQSAALSGIMSDNCTTNPDFCNFNRVHLTYCDGNSFSGNADQPLVVKGLDGKDKPLYFRGRRILDAVLETLFTMGLNKAERVLLTGCSAGGLAAFLHTDYVHTQLKAFAPSLTQFKSSPISGFFLLHDNVEHKPVYPEQMKYIFNLANSTHGLNDKCIAAASDEDKWKCNFAEIVYAFTDAPIFPLNSAKDSWQTGCILAPEFTAVYPQQTTADNGNCSAVPGWKDCANFIEDLNGCSASQKAALNGYIDDFETILTGSHTYIKPGNGAFIHTCHTHCEAESDAWNKFTVGGVTMQQAFSKWWNSDSDPAETHNHNPCTYDKSDAKFQCKPSCEESLASSEQLTIGEPQFLV
ncbi:unnamed protein product [Polarella glacialis]|uniref:Pectin acetylesterase n=2 Tax=Polarella glacialis TaxID=89957 RepID=A0A813KXE4_POLGL|nr:unnamed protein product [Polarella glacialis]